MITPATDRPVRRVVDAGAYGKLVVEVTARTVRLRPPRVRRPEAAVELPWSVLYTHALLVRENESRKAKGRKRLYGSAR